MIKESRLIGYISNPQGKITFKDSPSNDAFGRLRVSEPKTIFDSKQIFDNQPLFWDDQEVSGADTGSSHNPNTASTTLSVDPETAGRRIRQTFQRFNYQPGKSQIVLMTGVLDKSGGNSGISRCMGMYDDNNGIFLKLNGSTDAKIVRRTNASGVAVDNEVDQADWNIDKMDGTGASRITVDFTKTHILVIDFEWLGVGRARVGFNIDGVTHYVHEFLNANNLNVVYMSTPNLPLRYEIENDGNGGAATMECICSSVASEGGVDDNGVLMSVNMGSSSVNANSIGTKYAMLGIRLKSSYIGATIKLISTSILSTTNDNFYWEILFNPTVAGTFTYSDKTNSSIQIATGDTGSNPSTNTVTGGTEFLSGYGVNNIPISPSIDNALHLGSAIDGTVDEIVLVVSPLSTNLDISASLAWRELS